MSAFTQPETDSEDELPPGWEERATLGELVSSFVNINNFSYTSQIIHIVATAISVMTFSVVVK
jgi:hypothetical protein